MPIAAVPNYLGKDFETASPAMQFGHYLPIWQANTWQKVKDTKDAWNRIIRLSPSAKDTLQALLARQEQQAEQLKSQLVRLQAKSIAPFATGLGNEHPLENGFAFLHPYGLPYLPGSGVKGVLRRAATELASGEWGDAHGWNPASIEALFGKQSQDHDKEHQRGALTFWDVLPELKGNVMQTEIMAPHQKHYYQDGSTPHDSGMPIPITFLAVPPDSTFAFHVQCNPHLLAQSAPELLKNQQWQVLVEAALEHAFSWLGFGAKTAVGYGAMQQDQRAKEAREDARASAQAAAAEQEELDNLTPEQQILRAFEKQLAADKASKTLGSVLGDQLKAYVDQAENFAPEYKEAARQLFTKALAQLGVDRKKNARAKALWQRLAN